MTEPRVVLVGCGARKSSAPALAGQLYTGRYFRACLQTALVIAPRGQVLMLSARHGLLGLGDGPIAPYELQLGQPGAITAEAVAGQARARGIASAAVVALCGRRYAELAAQVWAEVATPLAGLGIGQQRHVLALMRGQQPLAATTGDEED